MLPQCHPNYKTVHRRFQQWCRSEVLRNIITELSNTLRDEGVLDKRESFIDATFASAKGGGAGIGPKLPIQLPIAKATGRNIRARQAPHPDIMRRYPSGEKNGH